MDGRVNNPWFGLPNGPPYVLPADMPYVEEFNKTARPQFAIDVRLLPEPFFGPFDAPVLVLLQNPGIGEEDLRHHGRADFASALRKSLTTRNERTHFHLTDLTNGPGRSWWLRQCKELIAEVGLANVASGLLTLEFSPYHSSRFGHARVRLPSQEFNFQLLRTAIRRRAVVIGVRGLKEWVGAVPELGTYGRLLRTNSARTAALSMRNLPAYRTVAAALR